MDLKFKKAVFGFGLAFLVGSCGVLMRSAQTDTKEVFLYLNNRTVVIDAGHGGWEPYAY